MKGYFNAFVDFRRRRAARTRSTGRIGAGGSRSSTTRSITSSTPEEPVPASAAAACRSTRSWTARDELSSAWSDIASGLYDDDIDAWAAELDLLQGRPYLRTFHHEMENEEGGPRTDPGTPEEFVAAYWYFRRRLEVGGRRSQGLTWVITYMHNTFAPYLKHGGPGPAGGRRLALPRRAGRPSGRRRRVQPEPMPRQGMAAPSVAGGPDPQDRTSSRSRVRWSAPTKGRRAVHRRVRLRGRRRLCAGTEQPHGTAKAEWFQEMLDVAKGWDTLEALCYSNVSGFGDGDYRIHTSPEALASFQAVGADPYFSSAHFPRFPHAPALLSLPALLPASRRIVDGSRYIVIVCDSYGKEWQMIKERHFEREGRGRRGPWGPPSAAREASTGTVDGPGGVTSGRRSSPCWPSGRCTATR